MIPSIVALLAPTNDSRWTVTTVTPVALARQVDEKLASLRQTKLSYQFYLFKKEIGAQGQGTCTGTILSPTRFAIQVPVVNLNKPAWLSRERWVADGKSFAHGDEDNALQPRPLSLRPASPSSPASAWFSNFSQIIASGIGQRARPFEFLILDAKAKRYATTVEERHLARNGKQYTQYRLVLVKGLARYETVVDGHFLLPTSVVNFVGKVDNSRWSAVRWDFPRKPLDPKVLTFRGPTKIAPSLAPRPR